MKHTITTLICLFLAGFAIATDPTAGQHFIQNRKSSGNGFEANSWTWTVGTLLGRYSGGAVGPVTIGTNLTLTAGGILNATGGGATTFAALTDVNLTTLASGDMLKWDGTDWINRTAANVRSDLGLVIGTNVQAWGTKLDAFSALANGAGVLTNDGSGVFSYTAFANLLAPASGEIPRYAANGAMGVGSGGLYVGGDGSGNGTLDVIDGATTFIRHQNADNSFASRLVFPTAAAITSNFTINIPAASGTMAVSASGNIALSAVGNITFTGNLPVTNLNSGTSASSTTFWRGDGTWAGAQPLHARLTTISGLTPGAAEKALILEADGTISSKAYTYGGNGSADMGLIPEIGNFGNLYLGGGAAGDIGLEAFTLDVHGVSGQVVNGTGATGVGVFGYSVDASAEGVGVRAGHSSASGVAFDAGPTNGVGAALRVLGDGTTTLGGGTSASEFRLLEPSGSGSNYFGFKSQAMAADAVFTLPAADGSSGHALVTNGSKVLSFASIADDTAYDATSWNGSTAAPTKNAIRDKLETMTGTGSVTSVALTVPAFLSVTGSPVTTSGTLAVSLSGTALPELNGGTGATSLNNLITLSTHTTGNYMSDVAGTANQITVTHTPGEGSTATISLPATITGLTSVTSTGFTGALTGNASTATALATARTIGGTSFDGTGNIVPATITVADTTDATAYVAIFESATGDLEPKTDGGLTYNASNGTLTATTFAGAGGSLTLDASGFNGNLATTDNTFQEVAQKLDDLSVGSGSVATDTIWDAKGDLAGGTGANTAAKLAVGTNGYVLTADSAETTGMKWAASSGGNWVLVTTTTISGTPSTVDFVLTGAGRKYRLEFENVYLTGDGYPVSIRTSTDGGSTYDAGASDYDWGRGTLTGYSPTNTTGATIELAPAVGSGTDEGLNGEVTFYDPLDTGRKAVLMWTVSALNSSSVAFNSYGGAGRRNSTGDVDAVRVYTPSTFAGGKIRLFRWTE